MRIVTVIAIMAATLPSVVAQSDTQPPQLAGMSFTPGAVDVTLSNQTVTFTVQVTDNLSGVGWAQVNLRSPSGTQTRLGAAFAPAGPPLGSATLDVLVTIPRYAEPGMWSILGIVLSDRVGNQSSIFTSALSAAGFPTTLTVIDANPDTIAPTIGAIGMSPSSVNVSGAGATVSVDVTFLDALSGFSPGSSISLSDFEIKSPSGMQSRFLAINQWQLISGNSNNGTWRATFQMPRYSEQGIWKIAALRTRDLSGNQRFYAPPDLTSFGSSIDLTVTSAPNDVTRPQLTQLVFTPSVINTSLGPQTIQVEISGTDDLSGVGFWPDTPFITLGIGAFFQSPSGAQSRFTDAVFSNALPISGTPQNGVWRFSANFPQFSEEGTWKVDAYLRDNVRNLLSLPNAQLGALGITNTITVIKPSLQTDGAISDPAAGGTVSDGTFGTRAQLIVPPNVLSQPTSIAIDVLQSPLGIPLPTGFSSAETYFVNVQLTPTPSFPLPAPGITVVLPLRNYTIPGTLINLLRIDPATGNLGPALNVSGTQALGQVNPGGHTATFTGIAQFSTVVGALPDAIAVRVDIQPGETPNVLNLKSNGTLPVAIFSTPTLDLTHVDPSTIRFAGAPISQNNKGKWQISFADVDGDGLDDLIAHFERDTVLLSSSDSQGVVEGRTLDNRLFRGTDSVRVK